MFYSPDRKRVASLINRPGRGCLRVHSMVSTLRALSFGVIVFPIHRAMLFERLFHVQPVYLNTLPLKRSQCNRMISWSRAHVGSLLGTAVYHTAVPIHVCCRRTHSSSDWKVIFSHLISNFIKSKHKWLERIFTRKQLKFCYQRSEQLVITYMPSYHGFQSTKVYPQRLKRYADCYG